MFNKRERAMIEGKEQWQKGAHSAMVEGKKPWRKKKLEGAMVEGRE